MDVELKFRLLSTSQIRGSGADDNSFHTMPSASPLLNQFPNVLSDPECPYRYPGSSDHHPTYPAVPTDPLPPSAHKLPTDYDPFKFLSAMAEQSLTGNFAPQAHASQSCAAAAAAAAAAASNTHFLFNTSQMHHQQQQQSGGFSSPGMTSPPSNYYTSQSSGCCMYGGGGGASHGIGDYSSDNNHDSEANYHHNNHHHHQQQHQQQTTMSGNVGAGEPASASCKKNFLCSSDLMETESENLLSWTRQHPEHWTRTEVLDWLFFVAQERGIDMQDFRGEAFQSLTGSQLCRMSMEEFGQVEPKYGGLLYQMFKKLLSGVLFSKPGGNGQQTAPQGSECTDLSSPYSAVSCDSSRGSPDQTTFNSFHMPRKPCPNFAPPPDGYWKQERTEWKQERSESLQSDVIDIDSYDFDLTDPPAIHNPAAIETCPPEYEVFAPSYPTSAPMRTSCYYPTCPYPPQLPRRRPGRPRVKSLPEDDERSAKDKKVKNQHLWEFIYETLHNPLYNPQYLRWENQREGVFRFVQSEAVAQLWGSRKNNENMTYEKLSRAMRHYYKRGILERVEGRRLVYKFSRKAMDRVREKRHASV
ncbi:ETS-related transcription factor Elf-3-like isoform X1 [Littorina saxatilis]|uniref:ETS-related transcription factor Elf-3-like isoform X1 n=1 Tax=Littorina saxatilis TaxID=31220 RepID=UPI0038B4A6DE